MTRLSRRNIVDNVANAIWAILMTLGTVVGCWMFYQTPYGDYQPDDYAVMVFRMMTGITLGFALSGFIVIPLRDAIKPVIYNLHKRAMEVPPRFRRAWRAFPQPR